jgi:hypothetical protein
MSPLAENQTPAPGEDGYHLINGKWSYCEAPHCDQSVLHAPGECAYCDRYPKRQQGRIDAKIAFTGGPVPEFGSQDPATLARPLEKINLWHGNVPMTSTQVKMDDEYYVALDRALAYAFAPWWKKIILRTLGRRV